MAIAEPGQNVTVERSSAGTIGVGRSSTCKGILFVGLARHVPSIRVAAVVLGSFRVFNPGSGGNSSEVEDRSGGSRGIRVFGALSGAGMSSEKCPAGKFADDEMEPRMFKCTSGHQGRIRCDPSRAQV